MSVEVVYREHRSPGWLPPYNVVMQAAGREVVLGQANDETEADEIRDRWRVALRNIDGPQHETGLKWCITHRQVQRGQCDMAHPPDTDWLADCVLTPLFFRDIKDGSIT